MQPAPSVIPVRTERQALDWSLVLVSQGIETTIEPDPDAGLWRLVVNAPDYTRALRTLRQYRIENRHRPWQQELPWTGLVLDWRCLAPLAVLVFFFALVTFGRGDVQAAGMMDNRAVHAGQWWRLFTAVTLHGDIAHLVANVATGLLLLGLAMGALGPGVALLGSFLAGAAGNLAGLIFHDGMHRGLGASGMVLGALGLLAAQWLMLLRHGLTTGQFVARGILGGCLLLVLLGFSPAPDVDVLAHVAGFGAGLALGAMLSLCPREVLYNAWVDRAALTLVTALAAGCWWLALR
jgi:membrane associated rhomboid family serine protease